MAVKTMMMTTVMMMIREITKKSCDARSEIQDIWMRLTSLRCPDKEMLVQRSFKIARAKFLNFSRHSFEKLFRPLGPAVRCLLCLPVVSYVLSLCLAVSDIILHEKKTSRDSEA